jgi:predicted nucleotidyltransferase component of viral defense system
MTAWRHHAPWQDNAQVEQDLVICRTLVEIFSDPGLREAVVFWGGTALHKLYLRPPVRYSEDIDLIQKKTGSIGPVLDALRLKLAYLCNDPTIIQKKRNNTMVFRFDSEIAPVVPMKLKIEINCREHDPVYGHVNMPFKVDSPWFSGACSITTFKITELLGSKMRALYQRKKGRDLFDLWYAVTQNREAEPERIVTAFTSIMATEQHPVSRKQYVNNMEKKIRDTTFRKDMAGLVSSGVEYDPEQAWELVKRELVNRL